MPLAAVQAFGLLCGLVGVRWSSAIVSPEVLGAYGLLVGTQLFGLSVTHCGFVQHVQRYWTAQTPARPYLRILLRDMRAPTIGLAVGLAVVVAVFRLTEGVALSPAWWLWMMAANVLAVVAHLAHAVLQAEERYWAHFAVSAVASATRSFLPLALTVVADATLVTLGGGFLLHGLVWAAAGMCYLVGAWRRPDSGSLETVESPGRMVGVFAGVGLCVWLSSISIRWFAAFTLTPEVAGYFMLALSLSGPLPTAINLIGLSYTFPPLFARSRSGASAETLLQMTNRTVLLALVVGQLALVALAWGGPYLVGIVIGARYAASTDWLLAAGGSALASVSSSFYCNLLVARNRHRACLWLAASSAAFRMAIMVGLALAGSVEAFRIGLSLIAWPAAAVEWWLARRWASDSSAAK